MFCRELFGDKPPPAKLVLKQNLSFVRQKPVDNGYDSDKRATKEKEPVEESSAIGRAVHTIALLESMLVEELRHIQETAA